MKNTKRQGDILIISVPSIPATARLIPDSGKITLAEGETAGHRHEILQTNRAQAYKEAEGFYLDVTETVPVVHPEHEQIALEPGTYRVIRQTEVFRKQIVRVTD